MARSQRAWRLLTNLRRERWGRSLGRVLFDVLLDGLGGFAQEPSYSRSREMRVWSDRPTEPEVIDFGHDYDAARECFA